MARVIPIIIFQIRTALCKPRPHSTSAVHRSHIESPIVSDGLLSFVSARVCIKVELVSWSTVGGRSRKDPRTLGLLLAVSLASGYVPGLDLKRQLPQGLFCQVVAEVVKEGHDVFVPLKLIMPEMWSDGGLINAETRYMKRKLRVWRHAGISNNLISFTFMTDWQKCCSLYRHKCNNYNILQSADFCCLAKR